MVQINWHIAWFLFGVLNQAIGVNNERVGLINVELR